MNHFDLEVVPPQNQLGMWSFVFSAVSYMTLGRA